MASSTSPVTRPTSARLGLIVCQALVGGGVLWALFSILHSEPDADREIGVSRRTPAASAAKRPDGPLTLGGYTRCLARRLGVDESLALALLIQESHPTDPFRVGKGDSRGPLQIKPIALKEVGLSPDATQLPILLYGGLLYLKSLLARYPDPATALAAYNMGPVRLKQRHYRPYRSTQRYVKQILARRERIQTATFYPHPLLRRRVTAQELSVFPRQAAYPVGCH